MSEYAVENVLGYSVSAGTSAEVIGSIRAWIEQGDRPKSVACANPHALVVAERNVEFRQALSNADWLLPDGIGIVFASRLAGGQIRARITGSDLFQQLMKRLNDDGSRSCFFLGSTEKTLHKIADRLRTDFPRVSLAGTWSPPYKDEFDENDISAMVNAVNQAHADVLWVGLTAPKQEIFIHRTICRLNVRIVGAIGAVFDFYAGTILRPSLLARRFGMEWLGRLVHEPRRLWRRTLVSGPKFGALLLRYHFAPGRRKENQ